MKMFQTPTQKLIAASATYCLYWNKKENKRISKFCELKWEMPVWVTPTVRSCGRKYFDTWNYLALLMPRVLRDHCLGKYDCAFAIHLSSTWEVWKLWSSEGTYIHRDTLVWVPFSCRNSQYVFWESKIQTWNTLSVLWRDEFPLSLQSNKNSDVGEQQWWVHAIWNFKPSNVLIFATPCDWVQHPPLCRNVYRVLTVMTESVSVFRSFFWAQAPWKQVKSTSVSWADLWLG